MEWMLRAAALCLTATAAGALLRRENGELSLLLALGAVLALAGVLQKPLGELLTLFDELAALTQLPSRALSALLKTAAIALTARIAGALCRDAGQSALAAGLDTAGALCAMMAAAPLLRDVLSMLEEWM